MGLFTVWLANVHFTWSKERDTHSQSESSTQCVDWDRMGQSHAKSQIRIHACYHHKLTQYHTPMKMWNQGGSGRKDPDPPCISLKVPSRGVKVDQICSEEGGITRARRTECEALHAGPLSHSSQGRAYPQPPGAHQSVAVGRNVSALR